jgi:hypothetical protein
MAYDVSAPDACEAAAPEDAPENASEAAAGDADGWMRASVERDIHILGEFSEIALGLAQSIQRETVAMQGKGHSLDYLSRASVEFTRISRAARMAIMLRSRLRAELEGLGQPRPEDAEALRERAIRDRPASELERIYHVQRIVGRVAFEKLADKQKALKLAHQAAERLEMDELYGRVMSRPVSELIAEICHDLGLEPDWPRCAQERWAIEEMASGKPGKPLAKLMRDRAERQRPPPHPRTHPPPWERGRRPGGPEGASQCTAPRPLRRDATPPPHAGEDGAAVESALNRRDRRPPELPRVAAALSLTVLRPNLAPFSRRHALAMERGTGARQCRDRRRLVRRI